MALTTQTIPELPEDVINRMIHGDYGDPFQTLGPHDLTLQDQSGCVIRAFVPEAKQLELLIFDDRGGSPLALEMDRVHRDGIFQGWVEGIFQDDLSYRIRATSWNDHTWEFEDPYRFGPVLTDFDLHLLAEGNHYRNYEKLGAHIIEHEGVRGVHFAVWAPNASRVSVVGSFNNWDGRRHMMRRGGAGFWELFLPEVRQGDLYKFEVKSRFMSYLVAKADPYGFAAEVRPGTASIVWDIEEFSWNDEAWMARREEKQALDSPMSVYELHLGSWIRKGEHGSQFLNYRELAERLVAYLDRTHFTHIELLPINEHPFDGSWGYQPVGLFAPTSRFGSPEDFAFFIDTLHQHGYGVLIDWVPAHFPRDLHGLGFFDGTHLFEHADPRLGEHRDWGTKIYNYDRTEVANYLLGNALFWLDKYHIDGLRVDAVASMLYLDYSREEGQWIPNQFGGNENLGAISFLKRMNELVHLHYPGVLTIAEESTAFGGVSRPTYLGGLGFSLKWNMGWMNDTLRYFSKDPVHRKYEHGSLTFSLIYAFTENFMLPLSHDEVVHGKHSLLDKMPGDVWQKFANLRLLYGYMYGHPGKKLLFQGGEIGQWNEWSADESLPWNLLDYPNHAGIQRLVSDLNQLYRTQPALHQVDFDWKGFDWLELHDAENSVLAFLRRAKDPEDCIVVACNFTPIPRQAYRIGVPDPGFYREILNTDSEHYGGANMGNDGGRCTQEGEYAGRPHSLTATLPPLGVVMFKRDRD